MDVDRALSLLGKWSTWRIAIYFYVVVYYGMVAAWHMLGIVFIGMEPPHHCSLPERRTVNESIPTISRHGVTSVDSCHVWKNYTSSTNETLPCPGGWTYGNKKLQTIVSEWDLVCERSHLVGLSQTILVAGVSCGAMIMSMISDKFGRKKVIIISGLCISIVGFITAWVNNIILFFILRFFTGFFQQGVVLGSFVYVCELFPASQRTIWASLWAVFWSLGIMVLAFYGWLIPYWRHLLMACSLQGLVVIPMIWVIPESLPWLVAKGRIREAKEVLATAAKWSNIILPTEFTLTDQDQDTSRQNEGGQESNGSLKMKFKVTWSRRNKAKDDDEASNYSIIHILKSRKLSMYTGIMCYLWCVSGLVYYGLSLNTAVLSGNPYINFMLSGLVEIFAHSTRGFVLKSFGRRRPIAIFHLIAGLPLIALIFIPSVTANGTNLEALRTTLTMIGKFGIACCFGSVFLYAPELYPTTLRNVGVGINSVGCRIGNLLAPFSSFAAKKVWWLPNSLFGIMGVLGALLTLLLPETLNRPLPQTVQDVEKWPRTFTKAKMVCQHEIDSMLKDNDQGQIKDDTVEH